MGGSMRKKIHEGSVQMTKSNNIYYPGQGNMFTTLALFVLKLEMMLLLEIVLTLFRLLLLLLPWLALSSIRVGSESQNVGLSLLIFLT